MALDRCKPDESRLDATDALVLTLGELIKGTILMRMQTT